MSTAVKRGYKQTEVGIIPEDWEVKPLSLMASSKPNAIVGGPFGSDLTSADYVQAGIPVIRGQNMSDRFVSGDFVFVSVEKGKKLFANTAMPGDLVFTQRGTLGQVSCIPENEYMQYLVSQSQMKITLDSKRYSISYVQHFFASADGQNQIVESAIQTGVPHTNLGILRSYIIPLPPTKAEQEAIAAALSDADGLIESLEKLVAKKRQIKHGTMQELLTGRRRLPGFSGKWETKRLGEVVDTDPENLGSDTRPDFTFNYISLEDVDTGTLRSYSEQVFQTSPSRARRRLRPKDVMVSTVRPNLLSHLLFTSEGGNWICSTGFCVVRSRQGVTQPYFVFSQVFSDGVKRQIEALLAGSNYPAINSGDVRALMIPVPHHDEQSAIAAILSDMDAEIAALEAKLAKARQIKQGMMQELLTGRVRLV